MVKIENKPDCSVIKGAKIKAEESSQCQRSGLVNRVFKRPQFQSRNERNSSSNIHNTNLYIAGRNNMHNLFTHHQIFSKCYRIPNVRSQIQIKSRQIPSTIVISVPKSRSNQILRPCPHFQLVAIPNSFRKAPQAPQLPSKAILYDIGGNVVDFAGIYERRIGFVDYSGVRFCVGGVRRNSAV